MKVTVHDSQEPAKLRKWELYWLNLLNGTTQPLGEVARGYTFDTEERSFLTSSGTLNLEKIVREGDFEPMFPQEQLEWDVKRGKLHIGWAKDNAWVSVENEIGGPMWKVVRSYIVGSWGDPNSNEVAVILVVTVPPEEGWGHRCRLLLVRSSQITRAFGQLDNVMGWRHHERRNYREAMRLFSLAVERGGPAISKFNLACSYSRLGKVTEAFHWLEEYKRADPDGFQKRILKDSDLDSLRKDPRFQQLAAP